jgi:hypothetical protein
MMITLFEPTHSTAAAEAATDGGYDVSLASAIRPLVGEEEEEVQLTPGLVSVGTASVYTYQFGRLTGWLDGQRARERASERALTLQTSHT